MHIREIWEWASLVSNVSMLLLLLRALVGAWFAFSCCQPMTARPGASETRPLFLKRRLTARAFFSSFLFVFCSTHLVSFLLSSFDTQSLFLYLAYTFLSWTTGPSQFPSFWSTHHPCLYTREVTTRSSFGKRTWMAHVFVSLDGRRERVAFDKVFPRA